MPYDSKKGGLAGLLLLGKKKPGMSSSESDEDDDAPSGGTEEQFFAKAFDAIGAKNASAFATNMRKGIEICVEKARSGDYEES